MALGVKRVPRSSWDRLCWRLRPLVFGVLHGVFCLLHGVFGRQRGRWARVQWAPVLRERGGFTQPSSLACSLLGRSLCSPSVSTLLALEELLQQVRLRLDGFEQARDCVVASAGLSAATTTMRHEPPRQYADGFVCTGGSPMQLCIGTCMTLSDRSGVMAMRCVQRFCGAAQTTFTSCGQYHAAHMQPLHLVWNLLIALR